MLLIGALEEHISALKEQISAEQSRSGWKCREESEDRAPSGRCSLSAGITHWPHGVPGGRELEAAHRPHRAPDDQEPKAWMQRTGRTGCRVAGGASSLVSGRSGRPRPEGTERPGERERRLGCREI